jgi:hypothetical protein
MADLKEAVSEAMKYIADIYSPEELIEPMLEEVQLTEDGNYWLITIGFSYPKFTEYPLQESFQDNIMGERYQRIYKVIKVRVMDGKPIAMLIRKL